MGLTDDASAAAAVPRQQTPTRHRRAKLLSAFAITAVVGVGSYAATYRALVIVSTPAAPTGKIAPAPAVSTTVPTPASAPAAQHP